MNSPSSSGFDRDLGPDADNYLQDITPRQASPVMIEYFRQDDDGEKSEEQQEDEGE